MPEPIDPKYNTSDVATLLGVTSRQARRVCDSVLGQSNRQHRKLTQTDVNRIQRWHEKFGKQAPEITH